jgi:glycogen operon protein
MADAAIRRITGSLDIYDPKSRGQSASVNFITCHDGFTLHDLYAYNHKHNERNGWDNTDGCDDNHSWNCGFEGDTQDPEIKALRNRMRENAIFSLMVSRGIPMLLAGDEFGNSQYGNNNAYCQDNKISWLDWDRLKTHKHQFNFIKKCIEYRNNHPVIRGRTTQAHCGLPDTSIHNSVPWNDYTDNETRVIGIMFAGWDSVKKKDDIVLVLFNMHWEMRHIEMPKLPDGFKWKQEMSTGERSTYDGKLSADLMGRSIMAFTGVKSNK